MLTLVAFVVALGSLIAVHEYGHYLMAVICNVRVVRFSIGFGKVLFRWQPQGSVTEFVICLFPIGGYIKMLDRQSSYIIANDRAFIFNDKPLKIKSAIVVAGPCANLILAILIYSMLNWWGAESPAAVLASPIADSIASKAGVIGGEKIERIGIETDELVKVETFEEVHWFLLHAALSGKNVRFVTEQSKNNKAREVFLNLSNLDHEEESSLLFKKIGIHGPLSAARIGDVIVNSPADKGGLMKGDLVKKIANKPIIDSYQLRQIIRNSVVTGESKSSIWIVERNGQDRLLTVQPEIQKEGDLWVGRIGAHIGQTPLMITVKYNFLSGFWRGVVHTWDVSVLTLKMIGRMICGDASLKNLSGPLTIADVAGKSANLGWIQYLNFVALISVSLGILNLLPLPVLDGGHLMYYLWEAVTGNPVSEVSMVWMQKAGSAILLIVMSIAIFNDITRLTN